MDFNGYTLLKVFAAFDLAIALWYNERETLHVLVTCLAITGLVPALERFCLCYDIPLAKGNE